jgi:hypothetical protein
MWVPRHRTFENPRNPGEVGFWAVWENDRADAADAPSSGLQLNKMETLEPCMLQEIQVTCAPTAPAGVQDGFGLDFNTLGKDAGGTPGAVPKRPFIVSGKPIYAALMLVEPEYDADLEVWNYKYDGTAKRYYLFPVSAQSPTSGSPGVSIPVEAWFPNGVGIGAFITRAAGTTSWVSYTAGFLVPRRTISFTKS